MNYILYWYQILTGVLREAIPDSKARDKLQENGSFILLNEAVQAQPAQTGSILFAEEVGVPLQNGR